MTRTYKINFQSQKWDHTGLSNKLYRFVTENCFEMLADEYQTDVDRISEFVKDELNGQQLIIDFLTKNDFIVERWALLLDDGRTYMNGIEFHECPKLTAFLLENSDDSDDVYK